MRIIAGTYKGRPLKAIPKKGTRPTADKIKESLFQQLGPFFNGGNWLDLYAGSGALGLEAISRGMDHAIFVDRQKQAVQTIKRNIAMLELEECTAVYTGDAIRSMNKLAEKGWAFQYIFIDPPYNTADYSHIITAVIDHDLLEKTGSIICEHAVSTSLPESTGPISISRQRVYGSTTGITIYQYKRDGKGEIIT